MKITYNCLYQDNYAKALSRLERNLYSGKFTGYTQQKKQQVWKRLCRYARQLGITVKGSVIAACIAAGLIVCKPASAQLVQQTGSSNPFNGVDIGIRAVPVFVDIDNDGDQDAFIGAGSGTVSFYRNTGTAAAPVYTVQTGVSNPFNGVTIVAGNSTMTFADVDNDADKDAFFGNINGEIFYFRNTGTVSSPVFTQQTGGSNPFNSIFTNYSAYPAAVDIDNDGDQDMFIGNNDGNIEFYRNTGTVTSPVYTGITGINNPLNGVDVGVEAKPTIVDFDGDGDKDIFIGASSGTIQYYRNTGTVSAPVFVQQTGTNNPLNGVDVGTASAPVFIDYGADGDRDAFIGEQNGTILFYLNTGTLPLSLLNFSGSRQNDYNELKWQTADELNTRSFEIERSHDGRTYTQLSIVNAAGSGANTYNFRDNTAYSGKLYYRLHMVDIDGRSTYSPVIWISNEPQAGITIYPNPAKDVITINVGNVRMVRTTAGIYDQGGRLLTRVLISNNQQQVTVKSLPKGVYTLQFEDGTVQRFIKE